MMKQAQAIKQSFSFWQLYEHQLRQAQYVDLTHTFAPGIPRTQDFPDEQQRRIFDYGSSLQACVHLFQHVGQWGTHVDAPIHFHPGMASVDQLPAAQSLLPLVVLDLHEQVARDPNCVVQLHDIRRWEQRYGKIPADSFVALRTDWSRRWPDQTAMMNQDDQGKQHTPGWSLEVLQFLVEKRAIAAIGHETLNTDPGQKVTEKNYECERYLLGTGRYQIELLSHLDLVPEAGALLIATWPRPEGGSGYPARAIALFSNRDGSS
jgi:kynurenine formamidase